MDSYSRGGKHTKKGTYPKRVKLNIIKSVVSSIFVIIALIWIGTSWATNSLGNDNFFKLEHLDARMAIYGAACFVLAIGLFCIRFFLKYLMTDSLSEYKEIFILIAKVFQSIHIPVALLGVAFITVHAYIALIMGFQFSATYIFGVITIIDMVLLIITSISRIFNKSVKGHKYLGILFVILFIIHLVSFKLFGIN